MNNPSLIDVERDELIPVRVIAKQRLGKAISPATLWRWVRQGCRGVRLEVVVVGSTWYTTPAAFGAFIRGQTDAAFGDDSPESSGERSEATRQKLIAAGLL